MKMGNYPLMLKFLSGAASANSGGSYTALQELKFGSQEEYAAGERFLQELCTILNPKDTMGCAHGLGMMADEGISVYGIGTAIDDGDGDAKALTMPYVILNRFY